LNEIHNNSFCHYPPHDSKSEFEEESERESEEEENNIYKNSNWKNKNKNIKCTDCDSKYNTIEEMTKHHYNIHDKNKIKELNNIEKERKKLYTI